MVHDKHWSPLLVPFAQAFLRDMRSRNLTTISRAYETVHLPKVADLLLLSEQDAAAKAMEQGWRVEGGIVYPVRPKDERTPRRDDNEAPGIAEELRPNGFGVDELKALAEVMTALEAAP